MIFGMVASITAFAGQDLVVNGSFEQIVHNFPAGWGRTEDESNRVTAAWSIDQGRDSANSLKIECTAFPAVADIVPTSHADVSQRGISFVAGQKYVLSFEAKAAGIAAGAFSVRVYDTKTWDSPPLAASVPVTGKWREYRFEFTATSDIPRENSLLWFTLDSTGTLWLDQVSLTSTVAEPGPEPKAPKFQPRLPGTAAKNLVPNGSFECGADGWLSLGQALSFGGNVAGLYGSIESGHAAEGRRAFRLKLGPGATPESYFDCWSPQHVVQGRLLTANCGWIEVEAGQAYTLSAYMRSDKPGTKGILQFNFNSDARKDVRPLSKEVALTEKWQRYSYTVNAPEDSVYVAVGPDVRNAPASASITFWTDAVQLEAGETATPFEAREPVELGFNSGRYGNVFAAGRPVVINVSAKNASRAPVNLTVNVRLTDYWDRPLPKPAFSLAAPARGSSTRPLSLDLPPGFYRAHFSWTTGGCESSRAMPLAVIKPYPHDDSPFGLNHGPTTSEACHQIKQAGITWVRDWAVNWEWAEPEPGKLSFAKIDPHLARLHAAGMNVLSLLPSNPSTSWASEAPNSVPNQLWYRLAYAPKDPKLLFNFVSKAAAHYKGSVACWEFLNEPLWVPDFCLPKKGGYTVDTYLALLRGAAAAIRSANPDAKILGGLAIQPEMTFGDEFIKAGGLDYVDIFNLHPYAGTRAPETFVPDMERIRRVMEQHSVRKPIWATEAAYYGLDEFPFLPWQPPVNHFAANRLLKSEQQAGDYLVRFSTILLAHGVEKIFWHLPVAGDANNATRDVGNVFVGPGGIPRKSYVAISVLANALGRSPVFVGKWPVPGEISGRSPGNVYGYTFTSADRSVLIAWATAGPDGSPTWALKMPPDSGARNIAGAALPGSQVTLSESPVFITSRKLAAGDLARKCSLTGR